VKRRELLAVAGAAAAAIAAPSLAQAPPWPGRAIRLIIPFPTGGTTDIAGRLIALKLGERLGVPVVVENKPGAGGTTGTELVAKSPPDGYTIVLGNSGALSIGPSIYPNLGYDVRRDFAPITMIADTTNLFVVHPSVPAKSLKELVAVAKAREDKPMTVAIAAVGSIAHLLVEQLKLEAGIKLVNVPYKGGGQAVIDILAGNIDVNVDNIPAQLGYVRGGRLRAIAVSSTQRNEQLPDVPTVIEEGYPSLVSSPWFTMLAPARTPQPILDRLNRELVAIMQSDDMKQRLTAAGANPLWSTPDEASRFIAAETVRWARVIKESGAKLE
jgi:tripartite-type tricarboxylate transporter receptor subunit TctC